MCRACQPHSLGDWGCRPTSPCQIFGCGVCQFIFRVWGLPTKPIEVWGLPWLINVKSHPTAHAGLPGACFAPAANIPRAASWHGKARFPQFFVILFTSLGIGSMHKCTPPECIVAGKLRKKYITGGKGAAASGNDALHCNSSGGSAHSRGGLPGRWLRTACLPVEG